MKLVLKKPTLELTPKVKIYKKSTPPTPRGQFIASKLKSMT